MQLPDSSSQKHFAIHVDTNLQSPHKVCCNVDAIYVEHLTNYFSDDQSETGTLNMSSSNLLDSPGTSTYVFIDSIISKMIFLVQVFSRHTT